MVAGSRLVRSRRLVLVSIVTLSFLALVGAYLAGSSLTAPIPSAVGSLPPDLVGESVLIPSASGSQLHGWFVPGERDAVILLHGLHGSRRTQIERARLMHAAGYSVLVVDFQAHGESPGSFVTFGYLESRDASATVSYIRNRLPDAKVAIIGQSLGGAAAILAQPPLRIDALVVESVYPDLGTAVADRLTMHLGAWATVLAPVLTWQVRPRLGFPAGELRPIDRVAALAVPKLFIAGSEDQHTRLEESQALFAAAGDPKTLWMISGAAQVDFYTFAPAEYRQRVLSFLQANLGGPAAKQP